MISGMGSGGVTGVTILKFQEDICKFCGTHYSLYLSLSYLLNEVQFPIIFLEVSAHFLLYFEIDVSSQAQGFNRCA